MKNVAVLTENEAFALFFRPHLGGFDSSRVPIPGNLPSKAKKMLMLRGQPGRGGGGGCWAQLELTDALFLKISRVCGSVIITTTLKFSQEKTSLLFLCSNRF